MASQTLFEAYYVLVQTLNSYHSQSHPLRTEYVPPVRTQEDA